MHRRGIVYFLTVSLPALVLFGAVVLSLLGYGAAAAIESTFGISRELVYDTPLDLLHLSSHAIAGLIDGLERIRKSSTFIEFALISIIVGLSLTMLLALFRMLFVRTEVNNKHRNLHNRMRNLFGRFPVSFWRWFNERKVCFVPLVVFSVIPWVIILSASFPVMVFVILPYVGYGAASAHLQDWIVEAEYCMPLVNREDRLSLKSNKPEKSENTSKKSKVTPCSFLWKNGALVSKGRHITSTNSRIILFDPESGEVKLEPIDGISVRTGNIQTAL